jgi:predicted TIM-barrel fold metal-dependent hydrolase
MRLQDILVVGGGVPPHHPPPAVAPVCDPPWRQVLEEEQPVPPYPTAGRQYPIFPGQYGLVPMKSPSADQMRRDLDDLGIDVGILFAQGFHTIGQQPNHEYARALTVAHNRWQIEDYLQGQRGLYGAIGVAPQDPEFSAREIERYAADERMCGVMMPCQRLDPMWGHRSFDPIFEVAERHGLPLLFHGGPPVQLAVPFDLRQFDTPFTYHTYTHNVLMIATAANLLATGVPVRYPGLSFVFIEAGIGFAAHLMMSLDRSWEDRRGDVPFLAEPPSHYMKRQYYWATQPIEEPEDLADMAAIVRIIGEDNVVYASDWPHHDFDHPKKVWDIPVSVEAKRKILGGTAMRILRLPERARHELVPGKRVDG